MEPRSGIIFCKNIYVAAAPIYVAAALEKYQNIWIEVFSNSMEIYQT